MTARVPPLIAQRMQGFHDAIVRTAPVGTPLRNPPQIHDVANEIEFPATQVIQEIREFRRMAVPRTQVHVRDEHRPPLR